MRTSIIKGTPIEEYKIKKKTIWVKREDLCCTQGGPPFSKIRGLYEALKRLRASGIRVVGYVETPISMAGWAVAWAAELLEMKAVIFDPQYTGKPPETINIHRMKWKRFSPDILPVKAGMTSVNQHVCTKTLLMNYNNAVMLPIGISFDESVNETMYEYRRTVSELGFHPDHIVVCVGSGTICAGILKGLTPHCGWLLGVMAYKKNKKRKESLIWKKAGLFSKGLLRKPVYFTLFGTKWKYTEKSVTSCPFPCHPYYDLKTWQWLKENLGRLSGRILFWNIGSEAV
jgi:tryptophan synthase beta subunit